jgi:hypothetical protein
MNLEQTRALVATYGYLAQHYHHIRAGHIMSVWPATLQAYGQHGEFVLNMLTLAGFTLLERKQCQIESGRLQLYPACLILNPPIP